MDTQEILYKRLSLEQECTSSSLLESYQEGRISEDEKFEKDGKILLFKDILSTDPILKKFVESYLDSSDSSDSSNSSDGNNKFNSFSSRMKLYNKLVLRGDDSVSSFICEIDNQRNQISNLEEKIKELEKKLSVASKQKNKINELYDEVLNGLEDLSLVLAELGKEFKDNDEYLNLLKMSENLVSTFRKSLKKNKKKIDEDELQGKFDRINIIKSLNKQCTLEYEKKEKQLKEKENDIKKKEKQVETKIDELKASAISQIHSEISKLNEKFSRAGEFVEYIRKNTNKLFVPSGRIYKAPNIPKIKLFDAIVTSGGEVSPMQVIAMFDASSFTNGKAGILVSEYEIYIYSQKHGVKSYPLISSNTFDVNISYSRRWFLIWFLLFVIISSIILSIDLEFSDLEFPGILVLISIVVVLFSVFLPKKEVVKIFHNDLNGKKTIDKNNDRNIMTFTFSKKSKINNFIYDINYLCRDCSCTSEYIKMIEKVKIPKTKIGD